MNNNNYYYNVKFNVKFVGFKSGFKNTDTRYSKALKHYYKNKFTGYVYIWNNYQYPIYRFENPDKQNNNKIHFYYVYYVNSIRKIHFVKNPTLSSEYLI